MSGVLPDAPRRVVRSSAGAPVEPSGRVPAPEPLGLVQAFLNTNDIEAADDVMASPDRLRQWLAERGLPTEAPLDDRARSMLVRAREAIRDLLDFRDDRGERLDRALGELDALAAAAPLRIATAAEGVRLVPAATGVEAIVARVLAALATATADGSWRRLKICRNDACRWSFYDASRNRSGHWCSMAVCGNRVKGRRFRRRRTAEAPMQAADGPRPPRGRGQRR